MNSGQVISIGVIGCGTIAYWSHLPSLKSLRKVRVAGLTDPDPDALKKATRLVNAPRYPDADSLLASKDIDAVVIASPADLHGEHLRAACAAGKHVYLEKPLAHDTASLSLTRTCTEGTALVTTVGFNYRFHPACQRLRQQLIAGSIGEVRAVSSEFVEPVDVTSLPGWKHNRSTGGGVLLDLATHHIDLYRWLLCDELARISADTRSRNSEQDSACVRATTRGGVELYGYFAFTSSRAHGLTFHGTKGVLHLDMHTGVTTSINNRKHGYGVRRRTEKGGLRDLGWRGRKRLRPSYNPSYRMALNAFAAAVADPAQRHADLATVEDGAAALQAVLDAESAGAAANHPFTEGFSSS